MASKFSLLVNSDVKMDEVVCAQRLSKQIVIVQRGAGRLAMRSSMTGHNSVLDGAPY
jgi:hypothetical protein